VTEKSKEKWLVFRQGKKRLHKEAEGSKCPAPDFKFDLEGKRKHLKQQSDMM
jgi:hypothetical protein